VRFFVIGLVFWFSFSQLKSLSIMEDLIEVVPSIGFRWLAGEEVHNILVNWWKFKLTDSVAYRPPSTIAIRSSHLFNVV